MHTSCEAPGQAGEGPEPWPCQSNAQSCAEGGRRPRLICTLSASDRDASQVRTHHHPPWEGRHGQWVGRGSLGEGPGLAHRVNPACRNRNSPGKWGRGRAGEGRSVQDQEPQQLEGQSHSRLRWGAGRNSEEGANPQGSCLLPTVAPDPIHSSLTRPVVQVPLWLRAWLKSLPQDGLADSLHPLSLPATSPGVP